MKKALIIVFIMCLLGMIFLSGSIGVFFEPIEVFNDKHETYLYIKTRYF